MQHRSYNGDMGSNDKVTVNVQLRVAASQAGWERLWRWLLSPPASATEAHSDEQAQRNLLELISADQDQDGSDVKTNSLGDEEDRAD